MNTAVNKVSAIFVTGNSRSGTTMMAKILGKNPLVFMFYELHFFEQLWYPDKDVKQISKEGSVDLFSKLLSLQREGFLAARNPKQFYNEAAAYYELNQKSTFTPPSVFMDFLKYESKLNNKKIPCEQTPRNLFFTDDISSLYPHAKIVCMIRDPRDVLLSQKYKWKRRFYGHSDLPLKEIIRAWFNYHPITISKLWNASSKKILSSVNLPNFYFIKFEELLENSETVIKNLCNFLEVNFSPSMLLIPNEGSSIVNDEPGKIGIDKTKSGNFLNGGLTKTEIYLCDKITSGLRKKFGYKDVNIRPNIFSLTISYISFPIKLFFALLLNIGRSKNLLRSIKRRFLAK